MKSSMAKSSWIRAIIFLVSVQLSVSATARSNPLEKDSPLSMGTMKLVGNGCMVGDYNQPVITDNQIELPMLLTSKKAVNQSLSRKTCQVVLPIQMAQGKMLIFDSLQADHAVNLAAGTASNMKFEIFTPGEVGKTIQLTNQAEKKRKVSLKQMKQKMNVIIACGSGGNLRMNTSLILSGGKITEVSSGQIANLTLKYKVANCR